MPARSPCASCATPTSPSRHSWMPLGSRTERSRRGLKESDAALAHDISHLRMCKDDYEIEQMRAAVAATHHGFDAMVAELTTAATVERGER